MSQIKNWILIKSLSYNARRSLKRGILVGSITIIIYLLVVILTTPNLSPANATFAALKTNSVIIIGLGIGMGTQIFISSYRKSLGCEIKSNSKRHTDNRKRRFYNLITGRNLLDKSRATTESTTAVLSSFFSFFSLVPLGCCGSWLLILSMLPSIFGTTVSIALIEYSKILSYLSLVIVFGFSFISAYKLRTRIKLIDGKTNQNNDSGKVSYNSQIK
ncbi:hypothetical protein [Candidatus Nitrosocosmicus hydrocola]|uniref:hypothetical protein n=1 Tax=Candidatus Nitrosocosmicus hydrocola TaxID=1826872 RepID=UPI000ADCDC21|nr:hypothetical protein [Candidatus Nitrosocosmicus hydrocola]